jgi:hypothetical protein
VQPRRRRLSSICFSITGSNALVASSSTSRVGLPAALDETRTALMNLLKCDGKTVFAKLCRSRHPGGSPRSGDAAVAELGQPTLADSHRNRTISKRVYCRKKR